MLSIFVEHGIVAHVPWWSKPMKSFELQYPMIQFSITYYLLTESEVITGKSQTEALMYWPSDSEVNT